MRYYRWTPGQPLVSMTMAEYMARPPQQMAERQVELTYIGDYMISTIFLSVAHGLDDEDNPYLFETMIFKHKPEPKWNELYADRYTNEIAARAGHRTALQWARENLDFPTLPGFDLL